MTDSRHRQGGAKIQAIIASARAGRRGAWEKLLAAYGRRLYGYFFRACGSHHDAEDLLGELMLRLVRTLGDYDDRGRFESWMFRISANLVRDRIRRGKARPAATSLENSRQDETGLRETIGSNDRPVDAGLLDREAYDALGAALEKLDETSRQMVLLRHFGRMSFKEIAEMFNCPIGTALAKVHRALKKLRAGMEDEDERRA